MSTLQTLTLNNHYDYKYMLIYKCTKNIKIEFPHVDIVLDTQYRNYIHDKIQDTCLC